MLSGTWRRSVGHQQSSAAPVVSRGMTVCGVPSGTVVLEAQYDYNYRGADGRQVCIREGERFILLKKTNNDWWQVRKKFIFFCLVSVYPKILEKHGHQHHLLLFINQKQQCNHRSNPICFVGDYFLLQTYCPSTQRKLQCLLYVLELQA